MSGTQAVLSVGELARYAQGLLDGDPLLRDVSVRGELSNYKIYPSAHYFTLKDAESAVRCVMFRSDLGRLRFRPADGMGVIVRGRASVYPKSGDFQLVCTDMLSQGAGDLQLAYEALKRKLEAEGLFSEAHKKPLPRFPRRVAVITSGEGAAVRDIIRVSGARWPMAKLVILPVRVQGPEAPPQLVGAIRYANRWRVGDLILTGRGGGSIEDLWAFNDERVARAIYESELPVISAVGHEPDFTIADYVADLRAATPSNGAELALPDQTRLRALLESFDARCTHALRRRLEFQRRRLNDLASRRCLRSPMGYIDQKRMEVDLLRERLLRAQTGRLTAFRRSYVHAAATLDALSPLKVLGRGYAVAENAAGAPLRSVAEVSAGDALRVVLSDGTLRCGVKEIIESR